MGAPMCRNVTRKHGDRVLAFDLDPAAAGRLVGSGAVMASSLVEVAEGADAVFLSLPGDRQVEAACFGPGGLVEARQLPRIVVDLSTTSVGHSRLTAERLGQVGVRFADAPVARTREAAERGELSIMVGAPDDLFPEIAPLLGYMGTDVTHVGAVGAGQFVKLVNNALLDVNVIAIAETMIMAERLGVDPARMIDAVSKGSGDSYALRNHAVKSMLPRHFPERSFPPEYKIKDLSYLLDLATELEVPARSLELALDYFRATAERGWAGRYFTAVIEVVANGGIASPDYATPRNESTDDL
jgi:3-hydroxyisobutyrate dehydrogenase-like beta-hydroxyacid dehydrogenase